jgi:hypothetical protein
MDILGYLQSHIMQIGVGWLALQNILKAIQDAFDSLPKDKPTPILRKIVLIMQAVSGYLFLGNRPTAIGGEK